VLLHVINGGLLIHELVIGDQAVQDAWEVAEAAAANPPPGPTPIVSIEPGLGGIRIVVPSGQRIDFNWTVPATAEAVDRLVLGCHIADHWAKGMHASVRVARTSGQP
jgi:FtsP/CotA-like multicopper oxidase with cupredoxin domain